MWTRFIAGMFLALPTVAIAESTFISFAEVPAPPGTDAGVCWSNSSYLRDQHGILAAIDNLAGYQRGGEHYPCYNEGLAAYGDRVSWGYRGAGFSLNPFFYPNAQHLSFTASAVCRVGDDWVPLDVLVQGGNQSGVTSEQFITAADRVKIEISAAPGTYLSGAGVTAKPHPGQCLSVYRRV